MVKCRLGDIMNEQFNLMLEEFDIKLNSKQMKQFETYYEMLVSWNEKMNLTAITERNEVYLKHFFDSISFIRAHVPTNETLLDVGSGAGFPSIPLKILYPDLKVTIIDSLNKRITFLRALTEKLDIDVELIHGRAEELTRKNTFDIVTARAVANLRMLGELCIPFVKKDGYFICMKGPKYIEEVESSKNMLDKLNAKIDGIVNYQITDSNRTILIIRKLQKSKDKYPRKFSKIKSNPL